MSYGSDPRESCPSATSYGSDPRESRSLDSLYSSDLKESHTYSGLSRSRICPAHSDSGISFRPQKRHQKCKILGILTGDNLCNRERVEARGTVIPWSQNYWELRNTNSLSWKLNSGLLEQQGVPCKITPEHSLPSDSYKYLLWNNIEEHDIQGSQLHCPRVRKGPSEEWLLSRQVGCAMTPKKRVLEKNRWEMWLQENWEDCKKLNISFQDLGDPFQLENFHRILRRLIRVETLWLVDNSLVNLNTIRLPRCRVLNMSKNYITSFKQLPKIPQIQHLSLADNHIETLAGLSSLRYTPLESLILKRNPCEFHRNYRKQVFFCLPNLKILDGILKLPEDCSPPDDNSFSKLCILS